MYDELYVSKETGEVLPATHAIREFYKTHGALEAWTDEWEPTGEMSDVLLEAPDFIGALCH